MLLDLSRIRLLATCAVVVVATASCGGDSVPTAPSPQSRRHRDDSQPEEQDELPLRPSVTARLLAALARNS